MFEIKTESPAERKSLLCSLILSIIILGVGLAWAYRVGHRNLPVEHALGHASEDLEGLQKAHKSPTVSAK
jgi:hypothetical protein